MKNPVPVFLLRNIKTGWSKLLFSSNKQRSFRPHCTPAASVDVRHPAAMKYPSRKKQAPDGPQVLL